MKIYTRTGDEGETGLFGGQRVRKDHVRVAAYGEVDELNAVLGMVAAELAAEGRHEMVGELRRIQADLLTLGANLATPGPEDGGRPSDYVPRLEAGRTEALERWIDAADAELEPLRSFILPGGTRSAAALHLARTVCRRAERQVITLMDSATIPGGLLVYLNRLSDLLFTLARLANHRAGVPDVPWQGGEKRGAAGGG